MTVVLGSLLAFAVAAPVAAAGTTVVYPGHLDGWTPSTFSDVDLGCGGAGTNRGSVTFVNGPATPPLGTGSVRFLTTDGNSQQRLRNADYNNVRLDSLTSLGYSTYVTNFNDEQAPYLTLYIDTDGDATYDDRLHFEPVYQKPGYNPSLPDQGAVVEGAWQHWDALHGGWYDDNGFATPGTGVRSIADYLGTFPNARIVNPGGDGGIRLTTAGCSAPSWDGVDSNVDAFVIGVSGNTNTYDFELQAPRPPVGPTGVANPPTPCTAGDYFTNKKVDITWDAMHTRLWCSLGSRLSGPRPVTLGSLCVYGNHRMQVVQFTTYSNGNALLRCD